MLRKANWDKTLQKSLKFSDYRKSIRKQIQPSCWKNLSTSFCVCLISWKQRNLDIRANIPKSCRRPIVSLWVGLHVLYNLCFDSFLLICTSFVVRTRGIVCVVYLLFRLANYKDPCKRCVLAQACCMRQNQPLLLRIYVGHTHLPPLSHSWQVIT